MIMTIAVYLIVGAVVTLICASGGGRARIDIELLGKEIDQRWSLGILLANAILIWPVVLWLMVMGKKADGSAAEPLLHDNGTPAVAPQRSAPPLRAVCSHARTVNEFFASEVKLPGAILCEDCGQMIRDANSMWLIDLKRGVSG